MRIVCKNCGASGEVDSGAPDAQGHFINVLCPICRGLKSIDLSDRSYDNCYGYEVYMLDDFAIAIDPATETVVASADDEYILCRELYTILYGVVAESGL